MAPVPADREVEEEATAEGEVHKWSCSSSFSVVLNSALLSLAILLWFWLWPLVVSDDPESCLGVVGICVESGDGPATCGVSLECCCCCCCCCCLEADSVKKSSPAAPAAVGLVAFGDVGIEGTSPLGYTLSTIVNLNHGCVRISRMESRFDGSCCSIPRIKSRASGT